MKARVLLASLLVGAVCLPLLPAGELPLQLQSKERRMADLLREGPEERILASLLSRCKRMHTMQIAVNNGLKNVYRATEATADKTPRPKDRQAALKLAESMKETITEVDKVLKILEKEGAAVAFPEVFHQLRYDMRLVQRRLERCDVGPITREIEMDIIDTLREMYQALKKAHSSQLASSRAP